MIRISFSNKHLLIFLSFLTFFIGAESSAQLDKDEIRSLVQRLKVDPRGPYHRIKWFCEDGSIREARDPCPDSIGGGIQHASYKDEIVKLGKEHGIWFGQILAASPKEEFWKPGSGNTRLKQYQLGKYLERVDDGWIMRRAKFYRGSVQSEDEAAWGREYYKHLLDSPEKLKEHFFLIRQSLKDIPFRDETDVGREMRDLSKEIADKQEAFMDARTKIHGQPGPEDAQLVRAYYKKYKDTLSTEMGKKLARLIEVIESYHAPVDIAGLEDLVEEVNASNSIRPVLMHYLDRVVSTEQQQDKMRVYSDMLCEIRDGITDPMEAKDRLSLLALSLDIEKAMRKSYAAWEPRTLEDLMEQVYTLGQATMGAGLVEISEWQEVKSKLYPPASANELTLQELESRLRAAISLVGWASGMIEATYGEVVDRYEPFEPLSRGLPDDLLRSSIALELGDAVRKFSEFAARESGLKNEIFGQGVQGSFRGLNPGVSKGILKIVEGNPNAIEVDTDHIYVFSRPPSDLKPVGGILSVSEGNPVSHVQLLARNLGIPNAVLTDQDISRIRPYDGMEVFYAVSPAGNIVLKTTSQMNSGERDLFSTESSARERMTVPVDNIKLKVDSLLSLSDINASVSGKLCGPKAANLGELKSLFPEHVVDGLVIPFGIFRNHMEQSMPGTNGSYWDFLEVTFKNAGEKKQAGASDAEIEAYQLQRLKELQSAIKQIPLSEALIRRLEMGFKSTLAGELGNVPVFLRSDTNMEDLPNFTGAGLNLTLFNVKDREKILQGIRDVWASPYSERSFKWRQQLLENPENVFPSILIIPTVDVEYSGVMITKGINHGDANALTVAISRGAGGAVDGQSAETWLITGESRELLSPARQPDHIRLPSSGGTSQKRASFDELILSEKNVNQLREMARKIRYRIPRSNPAHEGPYDVEFGFLEDHLWLFQIRPFVEHEDARTTEYLQKIQPETDRNRTISLDQKL